MACWVLSATRRASATRRDHDQRPADRGLNALWDESEASRHDAERDGERRGPEEQSDVDVRAKRQTNRPDENVGKNDDEESLGRVLEHLLYAHVPLPRAEDLRAPLSSFDRQALELNLMDLLSTPAGCRLVVDSSNESGQTPECGLTRRSPKRRPVGLSPGTGITQANSDGSPALMDPAPFPRFVHDRPTFVAKRREPLTFKGSPGTPGRTRTRNLVVRSHTLCPVELQGPVPIIAFARRRGQTWLVPGQGRSSGGYPPGAPEFSTGPDALILHQGMAGKKGLRSER